MAEKWIEAFTLDEIDRWYDTAVLRSPRHPSNYECIVAKVVDSVSFKSVPTGAVINLMLDTDEQIILKLNPMVALMLITHLPTFGQAGNWMDQNRAVCIPLVLERY